MPVIYYWADPNNMIKTYLMLTLKQELDNSQLSKKQFLDVVTKTKRACVLLGNESHNNLRVSEAVKPIPKEL